MLHAVAAKLVRWRLALRAEHRIPELFARLSGEVDHVGADVSILRHGYVAAEELLIARIERSCEDIDLRTRVVEVVLRLDVVAGDAEHPCECAAERSPSAVTRMERAGGIRADEFDLDLLAVPDRHFGKRWTRFENFVYLACKPGRAEMEVDEARRHYF